MVKLEYHPVANIFPISKGVAFTDLVTSIREHGQRELIRTHKGKIVDGRRRYLACIEAGVEPKTVKVPIEASKSITALVDYVVDLNLHRRMLDSSQGALAGAKADNMKEKDAGKERMREGGKKGGETYSPEKGRVGPTGPTLKQGHKSRDDVGKKFGTSGRQVDRARKVLRQGSKEVIDAVEKGDISVSRAEEIVSTVPKNVQMKVVNNERKGGKVKPSKVSTLADGSAESGVASDKDWHKACNMLAKITDSLKECGVYNRSFKNNPHREWVFKEVIKLLREKLKAI